MNSSSELLLRTAAVLCILLAGLSGCQANGHESPGAARQPPLVNAAASTPSQTADDAPPPEKAGGFDGKRGFAHVAKQVGFGPHPSGSPAIVQVQEYLLSELKSYGCAVETDSFSADTPAGRLPMKNLLVKIPGEKPGIILLGTHYDTKKLDNFVGADDSGSSTAVALEVARLLCKEKGKYAVWIAFFDGEEAVNHEWHDPDNRYGSRQMAACLAASGDLPRIKAFILTDLVGGRNIIFARDTQSTKWLVDLVWKTAGKLGYGNIFVSSEQGPADDHVSFLSRNVPSVDIIDLDHTANYWHTPQDAMDKVSAKSLAIVGQVVVESIKELQKK